MKGQSSVEFVSIIGIALVLAAPFVIESQDTMINLITDSEDANFQTEINELGQTVDQVAASGEKSKQSINFQVPGNIETVYSMDQALIFTQARGEQRKNFSRIFDTEINSTDIPTDQGIYQLNIEYTDGKAVITQAGPRPEDFQITNVDFDKSVEQGETFTANATVRNEGDEPGTQNIELDIFNGNPEYSDANTNQELDSGEQQLFEFEWGDTNDPGEYTFEINTFNDTYNEQFTILDEGEAFFEVDIDESESDGVVEQGEIFNANYTVQNTGDTEGTQNIAYNITKDGDEVDSNETHVMGLTLNEGEESNTKEIKWDTSGEEVGNYELNLSSANHTETFTFEIEEGTETFSISTQNEWNQGVFNGSSADRDDNSGDLGLGYPSGENSVDTDMPGHSNLVGQWRLEENHGESSDGDPVTDFSGEHVITRNIEIQEESGQQLNDYQIKVQFDSGDPIYENALSDGSDIRFEKDGKLLDHFIEEFDTENEESIVWVKVPEIPANGEVSLILKYGDGGQVKESDGEATFDFFDDFSGNSLDTDKWNKVDENGGVIEVSDGELIVSNEGGASEMGIQTNSYEISSGQVHESRSKNPEGRHNAFAGFHEVVHPYPHGTSSDKGITSYGRADEPNWEAISASDGDDTVLTSTVQNDNATSFDKHQIFYKEDNKVEVVRGGDSRSASGSGIPNTDIPLIVAADDHTTPNTAVVDWLRVREYADSEPGITVGDEEIIEYDGITQNGVDATADGTFSTDAYEFDGSGDNVQADQKQFADGDEVTMLAWVKINEDSSEKAVIFTGGGWDRKGVFFTIDEDEVRFQMGDGDGEDYTSTGTVPVGEWTLVGGKWEDGTIYHIVNDEVISATSWSEGYYSNPDFDMHIGQVFDSGGSPERFMDGKINDVMIFDSALSESEIEDLYFQGMDDTFEAYYISEDVDDFEFHDWQGIELNYSVPSDADANVTFQALDRDGNVLDKQVESLDGTEEFDLDVSNSSHGRVVLDLESSDVTESPLLEGFEVFYEEGDQAFTQEGLVGHWNAVSIEASDGDLVSTWTDQSGEENDLTTSSSSDDPVYSDNVLNGNPVLDWSGSESMSADMDPLDLPVDVFVVAKSEAGSTTVIHDGYLGTETGDITFLEDDGDGVEDWRMYADTSFNIDAPGNPDDWNLLNSVYDGGNSEWYVNGGLINQGDSGEDGTVNPFTLGSDRDEGRNVEGGIAEVMFYDRKLGSDEREDVEEYLQDKWGLN